MNSNMLLNKLKHLIKPTSFTHQKDNNFKVMNKFSMDIKKADLIFYGNHFGKNETTPFLKRENIKFNNNFWSKKDKSLYNLDTINVFPINDDKSNSFKLSSLILKQQQQHQQQQSDQQEQNEKPKTDLVLMNTSDFKEFYLEYDGLDSRDNSKLIFKKIKEIEKQYKNDETPIAHIFTENDFYSNELKRIKKRGEHNRTNEGSNIFFLDSNDTDKKCSHCSIGQMNKLDDNKIKLLEKSNYIFKSINNNNNNNNYNKNNNQIVEIIDNNNKNENYLVECNNCKVIIDKQTNQLINIAKYGEKIITKSRYYYLPHYIIVLVILNNTLFPTLDAIGIAYMMIMIPLIVYPSLIIAVCVLIPFAVVDIISDLIILAFKTLKKSIQ
ncbi:hypothetical protein ACTFIU_010619 [Dictyostelium citrinum]